MRFENNWLPALVFIVLCCALTKAADETTQKAVPIKQQDANATVAPATPAPKINVLESDLCKKCSCFHNPDHSQIDCSSKKMSSLFSAEEWKTLQNGDITFDVIKFEHSNITSIGEFPSYPVKSLYLGFNQIANITKAAFANLTELIKLDLSHNKLTTKTLQPDVFKGLYSANDYLPLGKMTELNLGHNDIHSLDSDLFEHLPKLESLSLSANTFQVIDQNSATTISGLVYLKTLDLSYMELDELPDTLLHAPRDLETLILSGNLLDELPDHLNLAPNLRELVLDENPIEDLVGENIFPTLRYLTYLSMAYMPELKVIGPGAFSELQNLTTLILSSNTKLSTIDVKAFAKNTSNPEILSYPPLEKVYLHNNNLSTLDRGMLERWDKITELDLRYNYWTCDCNNRWLIEVLMIQINNTTPTWTQDVNCYQPNALRSLPLLQLSSAETRLKCSTEGGSSSSLFLIGLLVGILLCIPIVLGSIALWRRGCFGLNRDRVSANRSLYNRANFSDELHI